MRPAELARDDSTSLSAVERALDWLETHDHSLPDYVLLLQPTSPLRTVQDIDAAIRIARERDADAVVSVCEAATHPFICQKILGDGTLADFVTADSSYHRRQGHPPVFATNGAIYLNRPESLWRYQTFMPKGTLAYMMPPERSLDLDTPWDWHIAELVLKDRESEPMH